MFSCSRFSPITNSKTMSKRHMQEEKLGEEARIETNVEFSVEDCQSVSNRTGFASFCPGTLNAHMRSDRTGAGDPLREV